MKIKVNGESVNVNANTTLFQLLDELKVKNEWVVCEVNGNIVKKDLFESQRLKDGDKLEIVSFVGGG
ncbi:MAG: sulfur carrier protein ThiS [bacterium]